MRCGRALALAALIGVPAGGGGCAVIDATDVVIIAHKGSNELTTENSISAFRLAYQQRADGLETDTQLTKDGRVIIMHDDTLDRTTTCTGNVIDFTLDELVTRCRLQNGDPIMSLDDTLRETRSWFSLIFVEIKEGDGSPPPDRVITLTDRVLDVIRDTKTQSNAVAYSLWPPAAARVGERIGEGFLGGCDYSDDSCIPFSIHNHLQYAFVPVEKIRLHDGDLIASVGKTGVTYEVTEPWNLRRAYGSGFRVMLTDNVRVMQTMIGRTPVGR